MSAPPLVVDARSLTGVRTGVAMFLAALVEEWEKCGPGRVVLLVRDDEAAGTLRTNLEVVRLGGPGPFWHVRAAWTARRRGARYLSPDSFLAPILLGRSATLVVHDLTPLLLPEAHPGWNRLSHRLFTKLGVRRSGVVIAPSRTTAEDVTELVPSAAPRLFVVPEAARRMVRVGSSPAAAIARGPRPYVLYVGTIEPRKNVLTLLRAFHDAAPPEWSLVLAGKLGWLDEAEKAEFGARVNDDDRISHLGYVTDAVLASLYQGADVFVYPSSYEGFGLPVLEAMSHGIATVASDAAALVEVGADAVRYVPLADLGPALTIELHRLLRDEGERRELGRRGLVRAGDFSWTDAAAEILRLATD